jgi:hypothetical protein
MIEEKNFENDIVFVKRPLSDIIEDAKTISPVKISLEVLTWIITNVENFIDNQNKIFKLDLVLDNAKGTEETKRLQDLYRAIPDDEEKDEIKLEKYQECRRMLDGITKTAFEHMKGSKALLDKLYERMIFYYERVIPNPDNKRRALAIDEELKELFRQKEKATEEDKKWIQDKITETIKEGEKLVKFTELEGSVSITNFDYDAFSVGVQIREGQNPNETEHKEKKVLKSYMIEEGFTVWVEMNFKNKMRPTNMF